MGAVERGQAAVVSTTIRVEAPVRDGLAALARALQMRYGRPVSLSEALAWLLDTADTTDLP